MNFFGLTPQDTAESVVVDVWPENWPAVMAFGRLMTQWATGMAGPTGIVYASVPVVFDMLGLERAQWPTTFEDVRVMEIEALNYMAEQRRQHHA